MTDKRWTARIRYCKKQGVERVHVHNMEELSELHDIIEAGPHLYELEEITIVYNEVY